MTQDRFQQIEELYHAVREASPDERTSLLSGADPELRREVESLLSREPDSGFLNRPGELREEELLEGEAITHLASQTISHYKVMEMLGAGGMGVVYKAFDTRLDRYVALKFLPTHLRHNADLKRRLKEEARAASTLDHPNIVVIHDIDETPEGDMFIAMAYHEGITLRHKIADAPGGLPVDQALQIARQIATGLAKAHERNILHRDIKPGNVIVAKDGVTRIIDFGLAKSTDATVTVEGGARGTPLYMSPEQASGKAVDFRTDIWSLGAVLYEMLAGRPPFRGESQLQLMRAVIDDHPRPLREARPGLTPEVERIVNRALEKDPANRYQSAADMARDLSAVLAGIETPSGQTMALPAATVTPPISPRNPYRMWIYGAAALAAVGAMIVWRFGASHGPVTSASEYIQITNFSDSATAPALSPDGRMVAFFRGGGFFLGDGQVYVKTLPDGESRQLTNDLNAKYDPAFTPDGSRVVYTTAFTSGPGFDTWVVPVKGGAPTRWMINAAGLSWIAPDRIMFSEITPGTVVHMGIVTARENRAEERAIYFPTHLRAMAHYSWASPDRSSVLLVEMNAGQDWQRCRVVPMDGTSAGIQVGPEGGCIAAAWSPDGQWLYLNVDADGSSHLWRQRWKNRAPVGDPEQITFGPSEEEGLAIAPDGKSLISSIGARQSSVWIHDGSGDRIVSQEGSASAPLLSTDGKRLYYLLQKNNQSDLKDLWKRDLASGRSSTVLTGLKILDYDISRDETQVAFTANGTAGGRDIFVAAADRSTPPRLVVHGGDSVSFGAGGILIFRQLGGEANFLARVQPDGSGLERIQDLPIAERSGQSPDGEWVLTGGAGGVDGVFAVSVKGLASRKICSTRCDGHWSPDGKFLYLTVGEPTKPSGRTFVLPIPSGAVLPDLPLINGGGPSGVRSIRQTSLAPGPDPETYAFSKSEFKGNLFRIPLH